MGLFSSIGNAFKSAGEAVASTASNVGNAIAGAAETAFDTTKGVAENMAWAVADGANLMAGGWQQVFSGDVQAGLRNIAFGMTEAAGLVPAQSAQQYEDAVGQASLWALRQSQQSSTLTCYSAYRAQVMANIQNEGLTWDDGMETSLRSGIAQMPWIDPNC